MAPSPRASPLAATARVLPLDDAAADDADVDVAGGALGGALALGADGANSSILHTYISA
jgi:hypothetical protein